MESFSIYSNFILAFSIFLMWITLVSLVVVMWIGSIKSRNKFFRSAKKSLMLDDIDASKKGITNDFEVYRNHRFGFKSKTVIELCQELEQQLKEKEDLKLVLKLGKIIDSFRDEYRFDDEKMNEIIDNVKNKSSIEESRKLREYIIRLVEFNRGIVYEKDRRLKDIEEKAARRKWINTIVGVIGVVGSIASIVSLF